MVLILVLTNLCKMGDISTVQIKVLLGTVCEHSGSPRPKVLARAQRSFDLKGSSVEGCSWGRPIGEIRA